jgi:peroxiredoxin
MIKVGDKLPSILIKHLTESGVQDMNSLSLFEGRKVVMFGIPGAFTPTCSTKHLPGYLDKFAEFSKRGIDIVCLSVNDPFVMRAWFTASHVDGKVIPLCDGSAAFTKALGLEMNGSVYGLGIRSQRFALYAEDGVIKLLAVEKPGNFEVSSAEAILAQLDNLASA